MGNAARHLGSQRSIRVAGRRRAQRAAVLLAGALLLAGGGQPAPALAASAGRAASFGHTPASSANKVTLAQQKADPRGDAKISIDSLTPTVPRSGDTLNVSGTVTNTGRATIAGAHIGLRVGSGGAPLASRSDISAVAKRTALTYLDGNELLGHTLDVAKLPAGATRPFTVKLPVKDLRLGRDGVYQLSVSITGQTSGAAYLHTIGIERTFLPWYSGDSDAKPTKLAFAWPLIDKPHIDARTLSEPASERQSPVFRDDELAAELGAGGRLRQLLDIGKDLPVTWVIDPDLLATVDAMARGYQVADAARDGDGDGSADSGTEQSATTTHPGTGTAVAKQWLYDLREAVKGDQVVALPFADPDLASIAHSGRYVPGTLDHLKSATDLAATTTHTVLRVWPDTDVAWPVDGAVDPSVVAVARAAGADNVLARSDTLRESSGLSYTPSAARPIGSGTTAVVADAKLSQAFRGDMNDAGSATKAVQEFLAQSLMITMEAPNTQRSVLVTVQRQPTASAAQAMKQALTAARSGGWVDPVKLADVEAATPDPSANRTVPRSRSYPARLRKGEIDAKAFRDIQQTQAQLDGFLVILSQTDRVITPFGSAVLRSMSSSWRGDETGEAGFRIAVREYLDSLVQAVSILDKNKVTLSGSSGTIPVTVKNDLAQQVTGLELRVSSSQPNRFEVGDAQPLTIDASHSRSLKFPTSAKANGLVKVTAQLYTADGAPYGKPMEFTVDVHSATNTVIIVIGVGFLLLLLAGFRMYRKRVAARRDEAAGGPGEPAAGQPAADVVEAPATPAADAAAGEAQPGDPEPDTSVETAGPASPNEKVER